MATTADATAKEEPSSSSFDTSGQAITNGNVPTSVDQSNGGLVGNGTVSEVNGKPYKNYGKPLKDIIKRNKNEVSFSEETVSLLEEDNNAANPTGDSGEHDQHPPKPRRGSILRNRNQVQSNDRPDVDTYECHKPTNGLEIPNTTKHETKCDETNQPSDDMQSSANNLRFSLPLNSTAAGDDGGDGDDKKDEGTGHDHHVATSVTLPKKSILTNSHQKPAQEDDGPLKRPPDGGWGWVVVFASFMINLISDGVSLSIGVLFLELVEYFGESKSKTSWVASLFLSIPLITGPIASALTDHFGCRRVAIAGSIFAALGFFLGRFSTKIEHLFIAFSISGFGISLCQVTSIVCVAYYFEKRRSLATGLSVCGTGFGTFVFAPLTIYLLEQFHWQGTLIILSGIFLTIICFALLIRDLDLDFDSDSEESSSSDDSTSDIESNEMHSELNSIAEEDENSNNESESEYRHYSKSSGGGHHESSNESLASSSNPRRITFGKNAARMRHISECEPMAESMPRACASLINIPTYIKNSCDNQHNKTTQDPSSGPGNNDSIGELTFRRGGYLHNLITYYPHLLSLFLPWNLECNDLTVKAVLPTSSEGDKMPATTSTTAEGSSTKPTTSSNESIDEKARDEDKRSHLQVDFITPPPSPLSGRSSENEFSPVHHTDSVAIPIPTPPNYPEFNFQPSRVRGLSRSARSARSHRHRLHQHHHLNNDLFGNYLHNLRLQRGSLTYRSAMLIISKYKLKASSAPDIYKTSMATINEDKGFTFFNNIKSIFRDMVDFSMFKNIPYSIFCLSNFILYACIDIPYVYLPDQAITSGSFDKEGSSLLISIIGVFNTLGVVFIGYIGDKPWLDASMIYAAFIALSGISLAAIPLCTNTLVVSSLTSLYGFAISANYSLVSVILVEFISLDSFTQAYGLLLLVQGVGSLIGPPIVGWLFDTLGSYTLAFYLTGICVLISGIFVLPVGNRRNCFLWSHRMSRSGSSTSLAFKPLSFIKEGIYGSNVCNKRNTHPPILRDYQQQLKNGHKVANGEQLAPTLPENHITPVAVSQIPKTNGHHVVIMDDDIGGNMGGGGGDDDENKRKNDSTATTTAAADRSMIV